jgi:lycopene cyclase domain-containing protein
VSYTVLAVVAVAAAVALDAGVLRTRLLGSRVFWTAYAIVLAFQLLTNGWLTGRGIVTYDSGAILGPRVAYAPVEDLLFGFSLVLQTLAWWVWWGRRLTPRAVVPGERAPGRARPPAAGS